jgi:predicted nuclease of restriction endonuclease-like (RecB) superfamily
MDSYAESDLAARIFIDPYIFDFLGTGDPRREAELELKLIDHIQRLMN